MNTKCIIVIFLLLNFSLKSQKTYLGVKLGLSSMYVTESLQSLSADYNNKTGFQLGMFMELNLSKYLSFQPELNYTNKGYKFNSGPTTFDIRLNYLELPLLMKPKFPIGETLELYGELGPSFSFGVGGEGVVNGQTYSGVFDDGGYKRADFGLNYGVGFNAKIKSVYKLGMGIRFFRGLSELYPSNSQNISGRNNGFVVAISLSQTL